MSGKDTRESHILTKWNMVATLSTFITTHAVYAIPENFRKQAQIYLVVYATAHLLVTQSQKQNGTVIWKKN